MIVNRLVLLSAGVSALALSIAAPASAQDVEERGEIIVTAELIQRPLRLTGNSVAVLTGEDIQRTPGLDTVRDILEIVPNVTLVTGTGKAPTVRGIDGTGPAENANAFFAGSRARLSWRIDGRPASYNEIVFGDIGLWDIDRVEVLRGPQSTLVGRNSIAGTIAIETRDPAFKSEGAAQIAMGNYDQRRLSGMINVPITQDSIALRLSADWYGRESATDYQSYPGVDDPGTVRALSLRGKLLLVSPSDSGLRLLLTAAHTDYRGPNGEIIVRPFENRVSNYPQQPVHEPRTTSISAQASVPLGERLSLEGFASFTDFRFLRHVVPNSSNARIDTKEYIVEPRLRYRGDNGLSAVAELYVYRARQDEFIEFIVAQNFRDESDTFAAYAEGVIPLGAQLSLSLGARYEREKRRRSGGDATGAIAAISADAIYDAFLPKLGLTWSPDDSSSWGIQISRGYNAGGGGIASSIPIVNYEYGAEYVWTGEIFGRQEWAGGRIRTTQNIFYSRYRDMQLPFDLTPNDTRDEAFVVRNADKVETWGAELGIAADLAAGLTARADLGLLGTRIADYPGSGVEGNDLLTAPSFTASGGLNWTSGAFSLAGALSYTGAYFTDVNNRPLGRTDRRLIADMQAAVDLGAIRFTGSVKNLFDSRKALARYPGHAPVGGTGLDRDYDNAVLVQPRTFLIGAQVRF
ncbi:outer membrane receptor protein involved in Fe transport [Sphingobium sp. AEW010]|uniref:TonB-dependent receptor n=1 Tax=Sphingobium sp. AEW001 TaxID=2572913 RepID=UPI000D165599|nr:TonB-dependent receptor [Sphingobium sp. AEW001]PSO13076.1 TonB-dependent receptor [Sphingobium sp. AEW4]TWD07203.1 outer membrane receptor protein involved in Fe transport [Sphingobium sp. AEW010]TWD24348.1 outer membrane receptor protein involved in Fe transport [Sphingobium sp. AEW013]TWD26179.1 outer membrane receptor protein involved in Fe transport [Sphingobium sp. AEW001]